MNPFTTFIFLVAFFLVCMMASFAIEIGAALARKFLGEEKK